MSNINKQIRSYQLSYGEYPISYLYQKYRSEEKYELCQIIYYYSKEYEIDLEMGEKEYICYWMEVGAEYDTAKFMFNHPNNQIYITIVDNFFKTLK